MEAIVNSGLSGEPKAIQSQANAHVPWNRFHFWESYIERSIDRLGWMGRSPAEAMRASRNGSAQAEGLNVQVEDSASGFADPDLGRFDLIVPIVTQETISPEACKNLVATVTKGTGWLAFTAEWATASAPSRIISSWLEASG